MEIGGATRVFALLGDPVAHSLSPVMQNAAFRALGLAATYVPLRCSAAALGPLIETLARQGGGGNVTVPHKTAAADALSRLGGPSLPVCNTFWGRDGVLGGAETDSEGIFAALAELGARDGNWCLIGTGGSAQAALSAARRAGAGIAVLSRAAERGQRFEELARAAGIPVTSCDACAVVINCTPLGLRDDDPLPLSPERAPAAAIALDLVYRRGETAWVRAMRAAGRRAADGRGVLVEQGAAAFERWFPGKSAPREVMGAAVRFALE